MSERVKEAAMCAALIVFVLAALLVDGWFASMPWPPVTAGGG